MTSDHRPTLTTGRCRACHRTARGVEDAGLRSVVGGFTGHGEGGRAAPPPAKRTTVLGSKVRRAGIETWTVFTMGGFYDSEDCCTPGGSGPSGQGAVAQCDCGVGAGPG